MVEVNETTATLSNRTWSRIQELLVKESMEENNPTLAAIADEIESQRTSGDIAVGFCGLPGAGKSEAAKLLAERADGEAISMGDAIRHEYIKQEVGEDPNDPNVEESLIRSEKLADFAAETREEDASQIPEWVTDLAIESDERLFAIDGVRSVTDYEVLNEYFERFVLVQIRAPLSVRHERLVERGREGEDSFTLRDMAQRDRHEFEHLGFRELLEYGDDWAEDYLPDGYANTYNTGLVDYTLNNDEDIEKLHRGISSLMDYVDWLPEPETRPRT